MQLVFLGECIKGRDPQEVRRTVAAALKLDAVRTEHLFSGRRAVLRREMAPKTAFRQVARFAQLGALVYAEPSEPGSPSPGAPTKPSALRPRLHRFTSVAAATLAMVAGTGGGLLLVRSLSAGLWPAASAPADEPARASAPGALVAGSSPVAEVTIESRGSSQAAMPQPLEDSAAPLLDELPAMSAQALREYRDSYPNAPRHRAFAIAEGGGHGWVAGAPSENEARASALERCMHAQGSASDGGCRVVDADGELQE